MWAHDEDAISSEETSDMYLQKKMVLQSVSPRWTCGQDVARLYPPRELGCTIARTTTLGCTT